MPRLSIETARTLALSLFSDAIRPQSQTVCGKSLEKLRGMAFASAAVHATEIPPRRRAAARSPRLLRRIPRRAAGEVLGEAGHPRAGDPGRSAGRPGRPRIEARKPAGARRRRAPR